MSCHYEGLLACAATHRHYLFSAGLSGCVMPKIYHQMLLSNSIVTHSCANDMRKLGEWKLRKRDMCNVDRVCVKTLSCTYWQPIFSVQVCVYWLVWTRTLHWEQLMRRLVPSSSRWGVTGCSSHSESSSVVVVKHISGIRGLVRIHPPATMTGLSTLFAHSVWQQAQHTETWSLQHSATSNILFWIWTFPKTTTFLHTISTGSQESYVYGVNMLHSNPHLITESTLFVFHPSR